jgi:hypothetical protein
MLSDPINPASFYIACMTYRQVPQAPLLPCLLLVSEAPQGNPSAPVAFRFAWPYVSALYSQET